jgi:hypothetical protein
MSVSLQVALAAEAHLADDDDNDNNGESAI